VDPKPPTRLATAGYLVVSALLVLFLAGGVVLLASTAVGAVRGDHTITVDRVIVPEHVPEPFTALPANVEPTNGSIPVTITIHDARPDQLLLRLAIDLLPLLLILAALWQLWGLLRSARQGDPFTTANVRRLRTFGWLLLLGWPLVAYLTTNLKAALADTAPPVVTSGLGPSLLAPPIPLALVFGLAVLVLAEVFANGLRLREDVEGTI
jgi:Protein of unknown function (DUF2975)